MKEIIINWFWKATECAQLKRLQVNQPTTSRSLLCGESKNQLSKRIFFLLFSLLVFFIFLHFNFNCSSSSFCHQSHPMYMKRTVGHIESIRMVVGSVWKLSHFWAFSIFLLQEKIFLTFYTCVKHSKCSESFFVNIFFKNHQKVILKPYKFFP